MTERANNMRAILVLLPMLPFSVFAQTPQAEKPYASQFRACVRAHAADAQAAGVRTEDDAKNYSIKVCAPLFGMFLGSNDASPPSPNIPKDEAVPPGLFRVIVREEWRDFLEQRDKR
jgi:hypothetical protein